jgi:hypothetical protein
LQERQLDSAGWLSGKETQMHCIICFTISKSCLEPAVFIVNGNSVCQLHATEPVAKRRQWAAGTNYFTQASSEYGRKWMAAMEQAAKEFEDDLPDADYLYDLERECREK